MKLMIKNNKYTCIECGTVVEFVPSLKARGMTPKQAQSIFYDRTGGKCNHCFIKSR